METIPVISQSQLEQKEQEAIINEVLPLIKKMRYGMEQLDAELAFADFITTSEFNYIGIHGDLKNYNEMIEEAKTIFVPAQKAEFNFRIANVKVLSDNAVLATYISSGTFYFPDSKLFFPDCATSLVIIKTKQGWKVIQMQESIQESTFEQTML